MSVATSTHNFIKVSLGSFRSIGVHARVANQARDQNARQNLSVECDWLLLELLRVANVAESYLIEWKL
jgi:hypothetical protein